MVRIPAKTYAKMARKTTPKERGKFNNNRPKYNYLSFDSTLELDLYKELEEGVKNGVVSHFFWQTPVRLPGGKKYVLDALVFFNDNHVEYLDAKGMMTELYKLKKALVEEIYPFKITEVYRKDMPYIQSKTIERKI